MPPTVVFKFCLTLLPSILILVRIVSGDVPPTEYVYKMTVNLSKEGKDAYGQMTGVMVYSVRDSLIKQWSHKITFNSYSGRILPGKVYSFLVTAPFPIKSYQANLEGVRLSWDKNTMGGLLRGCTGSVISVDSIEVTPMYLLGSDRNSKKFCSPDRPTVIAADGTEEIPRPAFFHIQCPEDVKQKNILFG